MLLVLAVGLTFVGATKTNRTGSVSSPLLNDSQTARRVTALTQANVGPTDTARFLDIDIATNGTASLVAHRPPELATLAQDIVVVATTNLGTRSWFALTNTTFAAGETNLPVALSREFLASCAITNLGIFSFCGTGDSDGDGLDDWEERFLTHTNPYSRDTDGDGDDDCWEFTHGLDPCADEPGIELTIVPADFVLTNGIVTVTNSSGVVIDPGGSTLAPTAGSGSLPCLSNAWRDPFGFTWSGTFVPQVAGIYTFALAADDDATLSVDSASVSVTWLGDQGNANAVAVFLEAGVPCTVNLSYANAGGPSWLTTFCSLVPCPAPKEPERSCGCGGYGTEVENGCVHFAQPFGATPGVQGLPTGRVVVQVSEPSASLYTPAGLRYDHPMMRRMIFRRNLDAIVVDALGNVTEYRRGLPAGVSTGQRGQLFRRADGAFVEELADGLRVVYAADGTVSALQPEHATPIAVADLGIAIVTNALGWVTNVASVADGQMATVVTGANAWRLTWTGPNGSTVKTFDFGGDGAMTFTLTEQRGDGAFAFNHSWTYDANARDWLLAKGTGSSAAVRTVRTKVYDATNRVWRITQSKTDAAGTVLACETSVLDRNGHAPRVTERRDGMTGQLLYAASLDGEGRVASETNALGAVTSYAYDAFGRVTQKMVVSEGVPAETTSFGYSADIAPIDFRPVWKRTSANGQTLLEESFVEVTNADDTTTRTHTRTTAGTMWTSCEVFDALGRTILVVAEDGRATRTVYAELVDGGWTATEDDGVADERGFALVPDRSTREVRRYSAQGNVARRERYARVDESWHLLDSSEMSYDAAHRKTATAFSDGTTESAGWICSGPVWTRGRDGVLVTNLYDAAKQKCASIRRGPFGDVRTAYARDGAGRVVAETTTAANCETQLVTRVYDSRGRVTSETSANGSTTATAYSAGDRVTTITNADGGTEVTALNADGSVASVTGTAVTPEFTAYGVETIVVNGVATTCRTKIVRTGSANSPRFEKTFVNGFGETVRVERSGFNGAVLVTENAYDACGHLIVTTETGKPSVSFAYDELGVCTNTTRTADGISRVAELETVFVVRSNDVWSLNRKVVRTSDTTLLPLVTESYDRVSGLATNRFTESFTVDIRGNTNWNWSVLDVSSVRTTKWTRREDCTNLSCGIFVDGLSAQTVNAASVTNTIAYDAFRRRVSETDGRGSTTTFAYDAHGHLVSQTDAATNTTSYAYDAMDRVTAITNALGGVTMRIYDTRGNLLSEGGATYPVNYCYDIYGNRTSLTTFRDESSGAGDTTTWLYDEPSGLVTNKVYADGHGPTYTYDENGRIATRTWARGVVTTYAYDGWGNLTNTVYSDGTPSISRTYDAFCRLSSVTDVKGTTVYAYDVFGSVTNEATTGIYTKSLTRHYDTYGRDIGHFVDGVRANTITYDSSNGRIVGTQIGTTDFQWSYLPGTDLKSQLTCGAVGVTAWSYEQHRDLLTQVQNSVNGSIVSQYDYTLDALGRRTQIAKSGSAMAENRTDTYGYNVRNELISAAHDGTNEYTYVYDDIGNRLSSYELGTNRVYTANFLNQYEEITSDAQTTDYPRFDLDGNQTNVTTRTGTWSVVYNGENRPILWTSGLTNLTMRYDFMGRRVEYIECVGTVTNKHQRFVYNGYLCIQRLNDTDNSLTDCFEWDPTEPLATRPLWWKSCTNSGTNEYYYTLDGNKNVSEVFSFIPSLSLAAKYSYPPFGSVVSRGYNAAGMSNPWKFSSEYRDGALPFSFYMLRIYNASDGRWTSRDRLNENIIVTDNGGAGNLYLMSVNDTIGVIDLLGEKPAGRYFRKKLGHVESLTRRTDRKDQERQRFWSDAFDFFTDFLDQRPHLPGEDFISDGLKQCMKNHETGTCDACCILVGTIQSDVQFGLSPVLKSASLQCEKCDEARRRGWLIGHREIIKTIELNVDNCQ